MSNTMSGKSLSERIGDLGHRLAVEAHAAWLAARDSRLPWLARILAIAVAAYALSPIDLIPDVLPVIGVLDDMILVPMALRWLLSRLPAEIRAYAEQRASGATAQPARDARGTDRIPR